MCIRDRARLSCKHKLIWLTPAASAAGAIILNIHGVISTKSVWAIPKESVCRLETQLEELRQANASQELTLQALHKQVKKKEVPRSPFKDAAVLEALPRLPRSSVTVSATILPPKHTQTSMQCLLHLSQKLKQEPLSVPTQKLVDKLVLAAQVRGFSSTAPLTGLRNWPLHIALLFYLWLNVSTHQQWDLIVSLRALQSLSLIHISEPTRPY